MPAAVAIAGAAAAQSAANAAQIAAEHRARCRTDIAAFNPQGASIERMKSYAECVQYMNPDPVSPESVPFIKAGIVVLLLAAIAGAIHQWREWREIPMAFIGFLAGPLIAFVVGLVVLGVVAGITYVLS
jgi:hypothetical protein